MIDARLLAVKALVKVNSSGGYSNLVVDSLLDSEGLARRDSAFATALFYGVLERMITLDYCIARYSKTPISKLDKQVREILRISFYQLLYMDSVPDNAAVHEGVALAKKVGKTSAGGFINGVLRAFLRDGRKLFPDGETEKMSIKQRTCIECSAPFWLYELLAEQYSPNAASEILAASIGRPPTYIKMNNMRTTASQLTEALAKAEVTVTASQPEGCMEIGVSGDITKLDAFADGLFHVQDKSSQICCKALSAQSGQRVLDVCSAPGGKAFTIAESMENSGTVVACDLHEHRVSLIASGAKRLGLTSVNAVKNDALIYNADLGEFDRVLCDVPCSGLGIIRRKPEIKYKNPVEFEELPELQYKILQTSSRYLKQGGVLIYSTCTLNKAENMAVVDKFLNENADFETVPNADGNSSTTLLPSETGSDGFFFAAMRRRFK